MREREAIPVADIPVVRLQPKPREQSQETGMVPEAPVRSDVSSDSSLRASAFNSGAPLGQDNLSRHVLQLQRQYGNQHVQRVLDRRQPAARRNIPSGLVSRDPNAKDTSTDSQVQAPAGSMQQLYVVRDARLKLGGTLVSDLESLKSQLMSTKMSGNWTLAIAMHGSQELLGAQAPPDWNANAKFYKADDIERIFGKDKDFVKWRDKYGPSYLSMASCQVSKSFESTLISSVTRAGSGQHPQGLGAGCKPIASSTTVGGAPATREAYEKLAEPERNKVLQQLKDLNDKWGYYGAPPVAASLLVHYYYDEDPKGEWVKVEVMVGTGHEVKDLKSTGIPFWNRSTGPDAAKFRDLCDQGAVKERDHVGGVPDVDEDGEASGLGKKKKKKPKDE